LALQHLWFESCSPWVSSVCHVVRPPVIMSVLKVCWLFLVPSLYGSTTTYTCIVLGIVSNLDMIWSTWEVVHWLYTNTMTVWIKDSSIHRFWYHQRWRGEVLEPILFCSTGAWTQGLYLEPLHQPFIRRVFFKIGSHELLAQASFNPPDLSLLSS
jgi:hypothetical protein